MSSRRQVLERIQRQECHHAGLWLDKFISEQAREDKESKKNLVLEVTEIKVPTVYDLFYQRWCEGLEKCGAKTKAATVKGRLAIGLGDETVLETSITLHRTYGVPYIPGSALKGLAASYTRQKLAEEWGKGSPSPYAILFGQVKKVTNEGKSEEPQEPQEPEDVAGAETKKKPADIDMAGYITFFDALYIPQSGFNGQPLAPDVMTVHHPEYYQQDNKPPADWDNPTPIHFLTATGQYLIALQGPDEWVETAFEILTLALKEVGVGAKTSSGYGRMNLTSAQTDEPEETAFTVGTLFRGTVKEQDDDFTLLEIDQESYDQIIGVIPATTLGNRHYHPGNKAWAIVTSIKKLTDGRTALFARPVGKKERKKILAEQ